MAFLFNNIEKLYFKLQGIATKCSACTTALLEKVGLGFVLNLTQTFNYWTDISFEWFV